MLIQNNFSINADILAKTIMQCTEEVQALLTSKLKPQDLSFLKISTPVYGVKGIKKYLHGDFGHITQDGKDCEISTKGAMGFFTEILENCKFAVYFKKCFDEETLGDAYRWFQINMPGFNVNPNKSHERFIAEWIVPMILRRVQEELFGSNAFFSVRRQAEIDAGIRTADNYYDGFFVNLHRCIEAGDITPFPTGGSLLDPDFACEFFDSLPDKLNENLCAMLAAGELFLLTGKDKVSSYLNGKGNNNPYALAALQNPFNKGVGQQQICVGIQADLPICGLKEMNGDNDAWILASRTNIIRVMNDPAELTRLTATPGHGCNDPFEICMRGYYATAIVCKSDDFWMVGDDITIYDPKNFTRLSNSKFFPNTSPIN